MSTREIVFVAGEASGDSHAAGLARELTARAAPFTLVGVGGDQMRAAGVALIEHTSKLAVMGFVAVLETIPRHMALLQKLKARLRTGNVAAVVLVDYPDFNMFVASAAADAGVPVLYYITPQVWAARAGRLDTGEDGHQGSVILPFEEKLLRQHGIDATFVGHPSSIAPRRCRRAPRRARHSAGADDRVLALFREPAARVEYLLDDFVAVARRAGAADARGKVIVAVAHT